MKKKSIPLIEIIIYCAFLFLVFPAHSETTLEFGLPCKYTNKSNNFPTYNDSGSKHKGHDIQGPRWTAIFAVRSGTVQCAGYDPNAGNYVAIRDQEVSDISFLYLHLEQYTVNNGDYVQAGDVIGYMGDTGPATGVHLHLGASWKPNSAGFSNNTTGVYLNTNFTRKSNYSANAYYFGNSSPTVPTGSGEQALNYRLVYNESKVPEGTLRATFSYPAVFSVNTSWILKGGIVSPSKINSVRIWIENSAGNQVTGMTSPMNPNSYFFDILSIDSSVKMQNVNSSGTYYYCISASDDSGNLLNVKQPFTASSSSTSEQIAKYESHLDYGSCGDDLSWEVDGSTLVITGSGEMEDYGIYGSPWYYHRNNITSVQLPAGLTKIGAHAFQDFVITNIDIPQSVTEIGEAAFERCYNLPTVTLPDNLKIIGSWVFRLSGITHIDIPYTLESLGTHAFAETAITEITLPAGLTEIDGNPFNGLTGLTIKGYAGTAAQTFANNNGFTFVLLNPVAVTGVSMIGGNQLTIAEYDQYQLTALISPANATNRNVIWSSSNPNFAEVDQNGLVTAKEVGTCTITAVSESNPDVWASVTVSVTRHTHISEWVTVQAPTYQAEGLRECRCTLCGNLIDEEVLPRLHIALQEGSTWPGDANNRTGYPTGNLQQGKGFGLRGVVIASENLVKVTGYVYSANGENALPPAVEEPNAPSLDIETSKINNDLIFSNLGEGTYRYTVVAQTVSGYTETVIDSLFSVGSAAVFTPANLPASFYAYVRHQSKQLYMTNQLNNIAGEPYTGALNQIWRFERQSSGAYAIFSELNGACVDVEGYSTSSGANVYAYTGGFNNTTNQLFYIYYMYDAYYLCPAHVNGASMVDMSLATNDFAIWARGENWEPQEFDIIQVKSTIFFNANGGSGAPSPVRRGYNENIMLPSRQPSRLGYEFIGWAETPDADSAAYLPGDQYTEKGNTTLYAVWSPVTVIYLPSGLTVLEEEAFANTQAMCVICPESLTSIGPRAFANCTNLQQIYIPGSVVTIDDTAFEGCNAPVDIWGIMDGYTTKFVDENTGFRFFAIE